MSPKPESGNGVGGHGDGEEPRSFEAAFRELQRVVTELEDGGLDLERAIHLFERGDRLAQLCEGIVDAAELRVTRLTAESASPLSEAPAAQ